MPTLGLQGPWPLTAADIDAAITQTSPGNYALGRTEEGTLKVSYVGRSDDDLNKRLKTHAGKYQQFKASYASSPKAAFEKECINHHDFNPPDNKIHPDRPANTNWKCPRCNALS